MKKSPIGSLPVGTRVLRRAVSMLLAVSTVLALASGLTLAQPQVPSGFVDGVVVGGLSKPVGLAFLPDGRPLVVEQFTAQIKVLTNQGMATVGTVPNVINWGERGLLGITVDPWWPSSPYLYVFYTDTDPPGITVSRFQVSGDLLGAGDGSLTLDPASQYDILVGLRDVSGVHNGGTLRFGPDHMLYISLGDDLSFCQVQDPAVLMGKILRIDVTGLPTGAGGPPSLATLAPADNPWATAENEAARLVWATGFRNPFRFSIDPVFGDLVVGDVGDVTFEEVDYVDQGGLNFGWPLLEGSATMLGCGGIDPPLTAPVFGFGGGSGRKAIIQGPFYRPTGGLAQFPYEYNGNVFYCDFESGNMVRIVKTGGIWETAPPVAGQPNATTWAAGLNAPTDMLVGPDGALWYCSLYGGELRRIKPFGLALDVPAINRPAVPTPLYFDVQGRRVDRPSASGVYFERIGSEKPKKKVRLK